MILAVYSNILTYKNQLGNWFYFQNQEQSTLAVKITYARNKWLHRKRYYLEILLAKANSYESLLGDKKVIGNSICIFCWMVLWSKQKSSSSLYKGNLKQSFCKLVGEPISTMKRINKNYFYLLSVGSL